MITSQKKNKWNLQTYSLFIQENGYDDTDDEDHSQDRAHHPYESITSLYWQGAIAHLGRHHCVGIRAGGEHFLSR